MNVAPVFDRTNQIPIATIAKGGWWIGIVRISRRGIDLSPVGYFDLVDTRNSSSLLFHSQAFVNVKIQRAQ